jgi:hypothetical protein
MDTEAIDVVEPMNKPLLFEGCIYDSDVSRIEIEVT